jgi:hypothetical protein
MTTTVINIRDRQPSDVYIGRAGKGKDGYFGNPFKLNPGESRGATIERFKVWFLDRLQIDPVFKQRVLQLRGKRLVCFCKPQPCHGDVIANWLNVGCVGHNGEFAPVGSNCGCPPLESYSGSVRFW